MQIIPLITLRTANGYIYPGNPINIEENEAKQLIARGFAKTTENNNSSGNSESNNISQEEIIDAISLIDPSTYNKEGKPNVKDIETILDANITAKQRDDAWELYKNNKLLSIKT